MTTPKKPLRGARLSQREITVMQLLVEGHTQKQAAAKLDLNHHTVETHVWRAKHKLGAATSTEAAVKFAAMMRLNGGGDGQD